MASKYANLPDIDSAKDIYETEDPEPWLQKDDDSSDEDIKRLELNKRRADEARKGDSRRSASPELVQEHLGDPNEARKLFRKQERKRSRRAVYTYPPSPSDSRSPSPTSRHPPLQDRLRLLQNEVSALEAELADPSNPLLQGIDGADAPDAGEMLRGLVNVRSRLTGITRERTRLIEKAVSTAKTHKAKEKSVDGGAKPVEGKSSGQAEGFKAISDMDARVAELEKLIGSNTIMIDESTPLPPPLLPQMNRLGRQVSLLSNSKNLESVSRRLKLLLVDLERLHTMSGSRRTGNLAKDGTTVAAGAGGGGSSGPFAVPPDVAPLLARLSPLLPTIPHLLQRLRTLSTLHTSASHFASTLSTLEEDQKRVRAALEELGKAVDGVEGSMAENVVRVEGNLKGLEGRLDEVGRRLDAISLTPVTSPSP